jgi:hypothetical protein
MAKKIHVTVTQTHSMVCRIDAVMRPGDELKFFLANDLHLDHPKCNREILQQHFEETIAANGYILLNGDILCVMQGISDKRHNKSSIRPEDVTDTYFDSVVDNAAEFLLPYAKHILFMGIGNHESAVIKRLETNLLRKLCDLIYYKTKHRIALGEYHGFIYVVATDAATAKLGSRRASKISYKIYHNHGAGGDAPITGGTIEDSRLQMYVEGVDAIWTGHNHNKYNRQLGVAYLDTNPQSMQAKIRIVEVIRSGTYKQEYTGHGFHIEKRGSPKPLGGVWLDLKYVYSTKGRFLAPSIKSTWHEALTI